MAALSLYFLLFLMCWLSSPGSSCNMYQKLFCMGNAGWEPNHCDCKSEARLAKLEMDSARVTLDQARRTAVVSGALGEDHHPP
uniref:Uncharacterized protein n=1 Tax=Rhipicephalus appendiculatus TaxID=34631 RepID=A0A131Z3D6_RHIAP